MKKTLFIILTLCQLSLSSNAQPAEYSQSEKYLVGQVVIDSESRYSYIALKDVPIGIIPQYPYNEYWAELGSEYYSHISHSREASDARKISSLDSNLYEINLGCSVQSIQVILDQVHYLALKPGEQNTSSHFIKFTTFGFSSNDKFNGELKPLNNDLSKFVCDYIIHRFSISEKIERGSITLNMPTEDSDRNNLPDWLQIDMECDIVVTGNSSYNWHSLDHTPSNRTFSVYIKRQKGERFGEMIVTFDDLSSWPMKCEWQIPIELEVDIVINKESNKMTFDGWETTKNGSANIISSDYN